MRDAAQGKLFCYACRRSASNRISAGPLPVAPVVNRTSYPPSGNDYSVSRQIRRTHKLLVKAVGRRTTQSDSFHRRLPRRKAINAATSFDDASTLNAPFLLLLMGSPSIPTLAAAMTPGFESFTGSSAEVRSSAVHLPDKYRSWCRAFRSAEAMLVSW